MARCSVVVCTQDRPAELSRCLQHVKAVQNVEVEIVVVDSAPKEAGAKEIAIKFGAAYVLEPLPGLSRARNAGARAAQKDFVAFLDDDAFPAPDWLEKLLPDFADPEVGAITGSILAPEPLTESEKKWESMGGFRPKEGSPRAADRNSPGWFIAAHFGELGNGSNMAFRRALFSDWRGFNEHLGRGHLVPGGEEQYAFFELIERGYRVVHVPDAVVFHPGPTDERRLEHQYLEALHNSGMYLAYVYAHQPKYRREFYRKAWQYGLNLFRSHKGTPARLRGIGIPRMRQPQAVLSGMIDYWRKRSAFR